MMSTWNYRVMEFIDADGEPFQEIREVYYSSEGKPNGYADRGAVVGSENIEGLRGVLERMREALGKPVLRECDFSTEGQDDEVLLKPPPGFSSWLDYVVATSSTARDVNIQSLFDNQPWGREVSREEIRAAVARELEELRIRAARKRSM